jgi:sulfur carrier protein
VLVELNGRPLRTDADTLAALLAEQGVAGDVVATALDGRFVPRSQRGATRLREGARIEVLAPMQGG